MFDLCKAILCEILNTSLVENAEGKSRKSQKYPEAALNGVEWELANWYWLVWRADHKKYNTIQY